MRQALKAGWAQLRRWLGESAIMDGDDGASTAERAALLDAYARERSLRNCQTICVLALIFGPLYWIVDRVVFADPRLSVLSALWRLGACGLAAMAWLLFAWIKRRNALQHTYKILLTWGIAEAFIIGGGQGVMGGIELPSFAGLYLLPFLTVPVPYPLRMRLFFMPALMVACLLGFLLPDPQHARHPHFLMVPALMAFSATLAVIMGQAVRFLMLQNFLQAQTLADRAQSLEQQIAERTVELRRLLAHVEEVREEERSLIARELHDELGQIFSALRLHFERVLPSALSDEALGPCRELVERAAQALRHAIRRLRPLAFELGGFDQAVLWLLREHGETTGSECEWSIELDEARLSAPLRTALFRVLQEALTNAARHAHARRINVSIEETAGEAVLIVQDDGVGFAGAPTDNRRSFGLLGMRERAQMLSGRLHVESSPGHGTTVRLTLPLAKSEAA